MTLLFRGTGQYLCRWRYEHCTIFLSFLKKKPYV